LASAPRRGVAREPERPDSSWHTSGTHVRHRVRHPASAGAPRRDRRGRAATASGTAGWPGERSAWIAGPGLPSEPTLGPRDPDGASFPSGAPSVSLPRPSRPRDRYLLSGRRHRPCQRRQDKCRWEYALFTSTFHLSAGGTLRAEQSSVGHQVQPVRRRTEHINRSGPQQQDEGTLREPRRRTTPPKVLDRIRPTWCRPTTSFRSSWGIGVVLASHAQNKVLDEYYSRTAR